MVIAIARTILLKRALAGTQIERLSFTVYLGHSSRWMFVASHHSKIHEAFSNSMICESSSNFEIVS